VQRKLEFFTTVHCDILVADLPGRRALQSASTSHLAIKLSTVGSHAFPVAAAQVWNSLPDAVVSSSLQTFRRHLITHLFSIEMPLPDF